MDETRRVEVELIYEGANISRDIAPLMIDLTYTDNAHGQDDDLSLTLEDREGYWRGEWFPVRGDRIRAALISKNWNAPNEVIRFPCGTFEVDEVECSGPPTQVKVKAVSTPVTESPKRERGTKAWENIRLSEISRDIATANGLSLVWDSPEDPKYVRKDQVETDDLSFLRTLCEDEGLAVKTTDVQLVVYSEEEYEKKAPSYTVVFGEERMSSYRLRAKTTGTYKGAKVQYHSAVCGATFEAYTPEGKQIGKTEEVLKVNQKVDCCAEAQRLSKKCLYDANKREMSGSLSLMGNFNFVGGATVGLKNWGKFDGIWFIEKATHNVSKGGGYTTSLEIRIGVKG